MPPPPVPEPPVPPPSVPEPPVLPPLVEELAWVELAVPFPLPLVLLPCAVDPPPPVASK